MVSKPRRVGVLQRIKDYETAHRQLQVTLDRFRAALEKIAWNVEGFEPDLGQCMTIAADALNQQQVQKDTCPICGTPLSDASHL